MDLEIQGGREDKDLGGIVGFICFSYKFIHVHVFAYICTCVCMFFIGMHIFRHCV